MVLLLKTKWSRNEESIHYEIIIVNISDLVNLNFTRNHICTKTED
jgi:hypothetical protein